MRCRPVLPPSRWPTATQEGANLLALQTRQQLSSTALSLASQADQAVLRLFR
jgi:flagellin